MTTSGLATAGEAELHVGSTALRLGANTAFQFLNLDDQMVQIRLSEGTLTVRLRNLAQNQVFEVDTPNVAFTLVRPGEYRIDANPDSQTTIITVRDGEGDVTGGGETFPVYARQQVVVTGDDQITYNLASAPRSRCMGPVVLLARPPGRPIAVRALRFPRSRRLRRPGSVRPLG